MLPVAYFHAVFTLPDQIARIAYYNRKAVYRHSVPDHRRKDKLRFFGELKPLSKQARFTKYLAPLREAEWVVYAKPPFGGPGKVLAYLGRYTHRVALSNQRLLDVKDGQVTFQWKDYRAKGGEKSRVMTLESDEFIRRFLIHVLPRGFQRIRFFGLLSNRNRKKRLADCRRLLN